MNDLRIEDATPDTDVTGAEKIPVSDGGVAKCVTVNQIKDKVLASIAALADAGAVDLSSNGIYLKKDGALVPLPASTFVTAVMGGEFGRTPASELDGNEVFIIKNGSLRETVTLAQLKDWLAEEIGQAEFDIASLAVADALADVNFAAVSQNGTNKKVTLALVKAFVLAGLYGYATEMTTALGNDDYVFVYSGNAVKKVKKTNLGIGGDVTGPESTTEDGIPQWDSSNKRLKNGKVLVQEIGENPTGDQIPTAAAVANAIANAAGVGKSGTPVTGNVPTWTGDRTIGSGKSVATSIRASGVADDGGLATEKSVRDAIDEIPASDKDISTSIPSTGASDARLPTEKAVADKFTNGVVAPPESHTEDAIPTWGPTNELKAGKSVTTAVAENASNDKIPTEKAVRDALPSTATSQKDGLLAATDKEKLDKLPDLGSVQEIGTDLDDSDTIIVKDNDTTWKKSLLTRLWTYISGKLSTFRLDALGAADDTTNLDSSTARHGLLPKLSGDATQFLAGDGTFKTPSGSEDFTGDSGEGGVHGLVPAPAAGDFAANKFLSAGGGWATPPSAAGVDIAGATAVETPTVDDAIYVYQPGIGEYRKLTVGQIRSLVFGTERTDTVFIPAGAMAPSINGGAIGGTIKFDGTTHDTMIFVPTSDTSAEFSLVLPDDWNLGALKVKLLWTAYDSTKAQAGQYVGFDIGVTISDDGDAISTPPADFTLVSDQVLAANELHRTGASGDIVAEGVPAEGALLHFKVKRVANYAGAGSPMPTEAYLLGAVIQFKRTVSSGGW